MENISYLYDSFHLADSNILTIPDVVMEAIDEVDYIYTEVKLDSSSMILTDQLSKLPNGLILNDILPSNVATRLDSYIKSKGFSLALLSQYIF